MCKRGYVGQEEVGHRGPQVSDLNREPSRRLVAEVLGPDAVEHRSVALQVSHEHADLHHVLKGGTGGPESDLDVLEEEARLLLWIRRALLRGGVYAADGREKDKAACLHRLRDGTRV